MKTRNEMDPKFMWDFSHMFETKEAWEKAYADAEAALSEIASVRGTLGNSAAAMKAGLDKVQKATDDGIAKIDAELKAKEVEVTKQTLDAEIRAKADAERYRQQQEAEAELFKRQKDAEARRYEKEQEAAAEMKIAEAQKYAKEQEAEGIAAVGKAEAEAIRAKALAEAEGIDKKAEAMKKYGEAAVVEMIMSALPEIAKNVAEPLSKVDKITMYGEGNSAKLLADIVNGTTQVTEGISAGMGLDIKSLLAGALGGKLASDNTPQVIVVPQQTAAVTEVPPVANETVEE